MDYTNHILVTGATGHQGGAVARRMLRGDNFKIHALVRDHNKPEAQALAKAGATIVIGDLNDRASLDRALKGVYGVFSVQSRKDGLETEIHQGKMLADAAKAAGVKHFVYSSVGSANCRTGIPHFDSKYQIEEHVRSIGIPHTIMRPVFFFYNYHSMRPKLEQGNVGEFLMPLSPDRKLYQLSEEDYGEMIAQVFKKPGEFLGKEIEAASVNMSMSEVADVFNDVLERPIEYRQVDFEDFEKQAGKEAATMFRWFENVGYSADLKALQGMFPPAPALNLISYTTDGENPRERRDKAR